MQLIKLKKLNKISLASCISIAPQSFQILTKAFIGIKSKSQKPNKNKKKKTKNDMKKPKVKSRGETKNHVTVIRADEMKFRSHNKYLNYIYYSYFLVDVLFINMHIRNCNFW